MEILIKSLASGVVTGVILLIASVSGPKLSGAIGGIPIVFAISYVMLMLNGTGSTKKFLTGGIYGAIAAIFFSVVLILLNSKFESTKIWNFVGAYLLCFLLAYGMVYFTSK